MNAHRSAVVAALAAATLAACSAPEALSPARDDLTPSFNEAEANAAEPALPVLASAHSNQSEPEHLDRTRFNITLKYIVPVTDAQRAVFEAAAARWERIIIADVPSVTGTIPSAFAGAPPASSTVVDDIVIEVALVYIDGPGVNGRNVLGSAGPRYVRKADRLPVSGLMRFDTYDLGLMEIRGIFDEVIEHEMGHVLGIGTLWNYFRSLRQGAPIDYAFVGKHANIQWQAEGGTGLLPVANVGAPGSIGSHWREGVLKNELMTPSIGGGVNPLSRITAASMRDLGYGVAIVGERYALLRGSVGETLASATSSSLNIAESEELLAPIGLVDPLP